MPLLFCFNISQKLIFVLGWKYVCSNSSLLDMHKNTEVHLQLRWGVLSLGIRDVEYKEPLSPRGTALPQPEVFPR